MPRICLKKGRRAKEKERQTERQREGEKEREGGREDRHGDSGRMRQEGRMDKIAVFIKSTANWCPCVHSNAGVSIAVVHHRKIYTLKVQWL